MRLANYKENITSANMHTRARLQFSMSRHSYSSFHPLASFTAAKHPASKMRWQINCFGSTVPKTYLQTDRLLFFVSSIDKILKDRSIMGVKVWSPTTPTDCQYKKLEPEKKRKYKMTLLIMDSWLTFYAAGYLASGLWNNTTITVRVAFQFTDAKRTHIDRRNIEHPACSTVVMLRSNFPSVLRCVLHFIFSHQLTVLEAFK